MLCKNLFSFFSLQGSLKHSWPDSLTGDQSEVAAAAVSGSPVVSQCWCQGWVSASEVMWQWWAVKTSEQGESLSRDQAVNYWTSLSVPQHHVGSALGNIINNHRLLASNYKWSRIVWFWFFLLFYIHKLGKQKLFFLMFKESHPVVSNSSSQDVKYCFC